MKNSEIRSAVAIIGLALIVSQSPCVADDETAAFNNPAQVAHAAKIADKYASMPNGETAEGAKAVNDAEDEVEKAQQTLSGLDSKDVGYAQALGDLAAAESALAEANIKLDTVIAELAGVNPGKISDMRESGMGLGFIVHSLGVNPGALGLGYMKENFYYRKACCFSGDIKYMGTGRLEYEK